MKKVLNKIIKFLIGYIKILIFMPLLLIIFFYYGKSQSLNDRTAFRIALVVIIFISFLYAFVYAFKKEDK